MVVVISATIVDGDKVDNAEAKAAGDLIPANTQGQAVAAGRLAIDKLALVVDGASPRDLCEQIFDTYNT